MYSPQGVLYFMSHPAKILLLILAGDFAPRGTGGPRTCGDEPTVLPNVPLFGAAAEDRASLRQRVVEKLQTLFDRFYVL